MTKIADIFYSNLSGGIDLKSTKTGLVDDSKKLFWDDSYNVEILKNKGVCTQKGNTIVYEDIDGESIFGICSASNTGDDFIYLTISGKIYYYSCNSGSVEHIITLETPPASFSWAHFLSGVVIVSGSNKPIYVIKSINVSVSELSISDSSNNFIFPDAVAVYASRVWVSKDSTVYFSALGTYDDWTTADDAGYIAKFHSSESKIVAMKEYMGCLAIYKQDSVYLLSGSSSADFSISRFGDIGTISTNSVVTENNRQYFLNLQGIFALEQFGELSQVALSANLSNRIKDEINILQNFNIAKSLALPLKSKNQIWFFVNSNSNSDISKLLIYDYENKAWLKRLIPYDIQTAGLVGGKIYTGDSTGKIFCENLGNTFATKKIDFKFSTPFFHFGYPNIKKILGEVNLIFDEECENSFKISVSKDYTTSGVSDIDFVDTLLPQTLVFVESESDSDKNNSCWANPHISGGFCWAEAVEGGYRIEVFDSSTSFQLHFESDNLGDGFGLVGIEFKDILVDD